MTFYAPINFASCPLGDGDAVLYAGCSWCSKTHQAAPFQSISVMPSRSFVGVAVAVALRRYYFDFLCTNQFCIAVAVALRRVFFDFLCTNRFCIVSIRSWRCCLVCWLLVALKNSSSSTISKYLRNAITQFCGCGGGRCSPAVLF